jgi:hypothetical protein
VSKACVFCQKAASCRWLEHPNCPHGERGGAVWEGPRRNDSLIMLARSSVHRIRRNRCLHLLYGSDGELATTPAWTSSKNGPSSLMNSAIFDRRRDPLESRARSVGSGRANETRRNPLLKGSADHIRRDRPHWSPIAPTYAACKWSGWRRGVRNSTSLLLGAGWAFESSAPIAILRAQTSRGRSRP